jgi:hypothetical protein
LFDKDTPWMRKFNRPVFLDLRTERIIEETFSIRYDPDYDVNGEYMILINLDISYNEFMSNYVSIEISNDNEILFSNKMDILEPMGKYYNKEIRTGNIIDSRFEGLCGKINLEFDRTYKINIETFFDNNLLEIKKYEFSVVRQIL